MNKKIIIGLMIGIILGMFIIVNLQLFSQFFIPDDGFDFYRGPVTNWNNSSKELTLIQNATILNGHAYKDMVFEIDFYKNGQLLNAKDVYVGNATNGEFNFNITVKLPEKPDDVTYELKSFN